MKSDLRGARPPRTKLPLDHRRGHERQGLGHGDDLRGAPRRRLSHRRATRRRTSSGSKSDSSSANAKWRRPTSTRRPATVQTTVERLMAGGVLEALPTFFECATAIALRALPPGRRRDGGGRGGARRPTGRDQRHNSDGRRHHVDRLRSPGSPGRDPGIDRSREGRRHQAGDTGHRRTGCPRRTRRDRGHVPRGRGADWSTPANGVRATASRRWTDDGRLTWHDTVSLEAGEHRLDDVDARPARTPPDWRTQPSRSA